MRPRAATLTVSFGLRLAAIVHRFEERTICQVPDRLSPAVRYADDTTVVKIYTETNGISAWQCPALLFGRLSVIPVAKLCHPRGECLSSCPHRPLAEY